MSASIVVSHKGSAIGDQEPAIKNER
jgi:hypothetical protein